MVEEALAALRLCADGVYVDATYGRGGHAAEIMKHLGPAGRLLALDRDPDAVRAAQERHAADQRFEIVKAPFSMLQQHVNRLGLAGRVDGVLFDLGVSSPQFDDPQRGFSFRHDGPLDMRMDTESGVTAAQWINTAPETEIARVIREYGEERFARRIARTIVRDRAQAPIATTRSLAEIVARAVPTRQVGKDPATRSFQAIRIHLNRELDELRAALPQAVRTLAPGGRLAVISFHSLEDRLVKQFMRAQCQGGEMPRRLPVRDDQLPRRLKLIGRGTRPSDAEIQANPRARSAMMRVAERTGLAYA